MIIFYTIYNRKFPEDENHMFYNIEIWEVIRYKLDKANLL